MASLSLSFSPLPPSLPPPFTAKIRRRNQTLSRTSTTAIRASSNGNPKVVVTRERGKNSKLISALAQHDICCLEFPLIEHAEGPDLNKLQSILNDAGFDWVVITSPEAGLVFLDAWRAAGSPNLKVGVVGAGTASVFKDVSSNSLEIAFTPSKATAKVLASELPRGGDEKCKVLYPASIKAGSELEDGLSSRGFEVTRLNTYTTVPVKRVDPLLLEQALTAPVVAVASPSAVRAWLEIIPGIQNWSNSVACIGETTGLAAQRLGLQNVYYPSNPGLEGWVCSILDALKAYDRAHKAMSG